MLDTLRNVFERSKFSRLPHTEHDADCPLEREGTRQPSLLLTLISLTTACLLFWAMGIWTAYQWMTDRDCIRHSSMGSPILEEVDISLSTVRFNGSFLHENIFRQGASPEVDDAWDSLGVNYRPSVVPEVYSESSGIQPRQVRVSPKYGGGFVANVEGLHHLHCLNLLRQSTYFNYEHYKKQGTGAFKNEDRILRTHITHCMDILRQQLMCTVDVGLLGQIWWDKEYPQAFPDFNTQHVCRDFEAVRRWAEENQAPEDVPKDYLRSPRREDVLESIP